MSKHGFENVFHARREMILLSAFAALLAIVATKAIVDGSADKAARKIALGLAGVLLAGLLLASVYLLWGGIGLCWAVWLVVGPVLVGSAMIAISNGLGRACYSRLQANKDRAEDLRYRATLNR